MNSAPRLPDNVQLAVCETGVPLEQFLYSIFWSDGSWYVFPVLSMNFW